MENIKEKIVNIINELYQENGIFEEVFDEGNNLYIESLVFISLLIKLEQYFDIKIEEDKLDYADLSNLDNLLSIVNDTLMKKRLKTNEN